ILCERIFRFYFVNILLVFVNSIMSLSSTQTRAAGKGGKEKATKISQNTKQISDNTKPQATAEQIRIAQLIGDGKHADADPELQAKVTQVMELTGRSSDDAMVALHDCDNDPNLAVDMLLEGNQQQGEWELSGKKKKNRQPVPVSKSTNVETVKNGSSGPVSNKENRNGRNDRHRENGKDRENSRSRGPPRLNRGKGWRGRET
ncbi:UBAP2 (predicted), partial [Pycnogonum litorale]